MEPGLTTTAVTGILQFVALAISFGVIGGSAKPYENPNPNFSSAVQRFYWPLKPVVPIAEKDEQKEKREVCSTPGCIHTASRILENMNPEVGPCDDFYNFACGGFEKATTIPDDKSSVSVFSAISDTLGQKLRAGIEEPSRSDEPRPFTLAKNLYKACMNKTAIEVAGLKSLREILRQLGTWPVLEGDIWKDEEFHWTTVVYRLRNLGYSMDYFITFSIDVDMKNGTKRVISLDQASLGLSHEYLVDGIGDRIVKAYLKYMVDVAVIFGADEERATQELTESLQFEIKLAKISLPSENRRNATLLYNPMTIAELKKRYPNVDWKEYINSLLPPSLHVGDNEVVIVRVPNFLSDLAELLRTTPKRVQANYAMWSAVRDSVEFSTENLRRVQLNYLSVLNGERERSSRWRECVDLVANGLSISTGALYVRKYFKEDAKNVAVEMVADIRNEFRKILEKTEWMDENTKTKALEKAASMSSHIAYPDELLDDKKLDKFYSGLELREHDYLGGILNLTLFQAENAFEKLRKPVNKTDWIAHGRSAIVNAFYSPTENSIQFPAGILQGALFSNDRPRYMNYGAIGSAIGHEITHGFDDQGRQFDKDGNLVDWWAPETQEKYLKKAQCFIHQYGNYTAESVGLHLNGINTQGENIADNGGIEVAYLAYKKWVKRNGPEPELPGLGYTPEQMFWISAANSWCIKIRREELKFQIMTDPHSPAQFRVLGPLSNMPQFSADFNCPLGSAMNPKHKCSVW